MDIRHEAEFVRIEHLSQEQENIYQASKNKYAMYRKLYKYAVEQGDLKWGSVINQKELDICQNAINELALIRELI